ncbi:L,D-transpeptidase [Mycobacterium sp.]|jgi:lipoprotein-anchoring transpeptidase ErfK/SrfK|uniref:L,D-transpeptidase n=1 Tax=Mycobacterium sp. TaxID=1785 RepID=UPI002D446A57|nr:Ig-like domain-containing protein [Mycobacterium sp.]HZA11572.1 Ig-like domain-containing protein [Mycobacterium sp.]
MLSRRRVLSVFAVGVVAPGALASCFGGSSKQSQSAPPPKPTVTYRPANGASDIVPTAPVGADVRDGWFQRVTLTNSDGKMVAGSVSHDRTSFAVTEPLGYGVEYTWGGSVVGRDGTVMPVSGGFTTVKPHKTVSGQFQLADGQSVGVAAPIILQFNSSISDKAAVERALRVTTDPQTEGSWAWLPDEKQGSRAHWRTKEYYQPGTNVTVEAKIYGVSFGDGEYGAEDLSLHFTIGRRQIVKAHAPSHRIQVLNQDGAVIMDFPCSYGEADQPRNVTRTGTHVVSEKHADFWMSNPAAGYSNVHERYAVRISNNGEFIHCNPESLGAQGNTNVTNGCINLNLDNAIQYFNSAIYGDPVEVTGTSIRLSYSDGDIWDWAVDWDTWVAMSALSGTQPPPGMPSTAPATPSGAPQPVNGRPGG